MKEHKHTCACCHRDWTCPPFGDRRKTCGVEKAAKTNGRGPYCLLCQAGIMFLRYARNELRNPFTTLREIAKHDRR